MRRHREICQQSRKSSTYAPLSLCWGDRNADEDWRILVVACRIHLIRPYLFEKFITLSSRLVVLAMNCNFCLPISQRASQVDGVPGVCLRAPAIPVCQGDASDCPADFRPFPAYHRIASRSVPLSELTREPISVLD